MPARLTVHLPSRPALVFLLPEGRRTVVGRDPECEVALDDDRVSRRHARFDPSSSGWSITDLGSKNGLLVDGMPQATATLSERSWISLGGLIARFEVVSGSLEEALEEPRRRWATSLAVRRRLTPSAGLGELLPRVVASMLELTHAERGFLLLADAGGELQVAARSGLSWDEIRGEAFAGSRGAVRTALATGASVVRSDVRTDSELGERPSIVDAGIRALCCVPVHALDRLIGVMYADSREPGTAFTVLDLEILEALSSQAGLAIAVARLGGELAGLAERIAEITGGDPALLDRISGELSGAVERSLQPAQATAYRPERWTQSAGVAANGSER